MAKAILTLKIMPESPEVDLDRVTLEAEKLIRGFAGDTDHRVTREPIAFGLVAINIIFVFDEKLGGTDKLESDLETIEGVNSVEVTDIRRAIG
jgi:elongation factor 1-beta